MLDLKRRFNFKYSINDDSKKDTHDKWGYFELNNDLDNLVLWGHNSVHLFGAMAISIVWGFWAGYGFWFAWELLDGIKPLWTAYKATAVIKTDAFMEKNNYFPGVWRVRLWKTMDYVRENGMYSDKFSYQDAFIHDLYGALAGLAIHNLLIKHEVVTLLIETAKGLIQTQ